MSKLTHTIVDSKMLYLDLKDLKKETIDFLYPHSFESGRTEKIKSVFPQGFLPESVKDIDVADKVLFSEGWGDTIAAHMLKGKLESCQY